MFIDLFIYKHDNIIHYVCIILLLLLDTVPSDIDIGDNDSDTASQEATPTSSVASPPEHATSFLPGSERRQVEKTQTNTFQCFTHHFTCKILCSALCILSVVCVSSVSAHVSVCVCVSDCEARPSHDV